MLTKDTKYRLVHAVTSQEVADEIEKRLAADPADQNEAAALLADLSKENLQERLVVALAGDGSQGRELAKKLNGAVEVLKGYVAEVPASPGVAASFSGQVAGMTTDVDIEADNVGEDGNLVVLTGDGAQDIDALILDWNTNNPANTISLTSGDGSQIPDLGAEIELAGGVDANPGDDQALVAAQAAMGSESLSEAALECLTLALTDAKAAEEFKAAYDAMVVNLQNL